MVALGSMVVSIDQLVVGKIYDCTVPDCTWEDEPCHEDWFKIKVLSVNKATSIARLSHSH